MSTLASVSELNGAEAVFSSHLSVSLPPLGCLSDHSTGIIDNRPFKILIQLKLNPQMSIAVSNYMEGCSESDIFLHKTEK